MVHLPVVQLNVLLLYSDFLLSSIHLMMPQSWLVMVKTSFRLFNMFSNCSISLHLFLSVLILTLYSTVVSVRNNRRNTVHPKI